MEKQICSKCKMEKEITEFSISRKFVTGRQVYCKCCASIAKREWRLKHPDYEKNLKKLRYHSEPNFKLAERGRIRIYQALKQQNKSNSIQELVSCSDFELIDWIGSQFDTNMTWDNYGSYWQINHIKPVSSFDLTDPVQLRDCFHYTNLEPIEKSLNQSIMTAGYPYKQSVKRNIL